MDAGRFLGLVVAASLLSACGTLGLERSADPAAAHAAAAAPGEIGQAAPGRAFGTMDPIPNPPEPGARRAASPSTPQPAKAAATRAAQSRPAAAPAAEGRQAISRANAEARESSRADAFVGGLQIFSYAPGRVFEVWTAPLRVTTLTLGPGEEVTAKAAGDTVRWQIGEAISGAGPERRTHVLIKPLERQLETNLVLTTNQRVYLVQLKSGPPESFNAAVAWDLGVLSPPLTPTHRQAQAPVADPLVTPAGPLDARFRITSRGRRPAWSPASVTTDGVRTFIAFPAALQASQAPALFVLGEGGERQMVNYRQQGELMVVDRVLDRAELRLGLVRPQVVRITRLSGGRS